jgi:hypothetical protein
MNYPSEDFFKETWRKPVTIAERRMVLKQPSGN